MSALALIPCLLPAQTIHDTVFDEFVVAHTLGWWGKALIIRNYTMLWVPATAAAAAAVGGGGWDGPAPARLRLAGTMLSYPRMPVA
jgi:hypothetical protein